MARSPPFIMTVILATVMRIALADWSTKNTFDTSPGTVYSCFVVTSGGVVAAGRADGSTIDFLDAATGVGIGSTTFLGVPGNVAILAAANAQTLVAIFSDGTVATVTISSTNRQFSGNLLMSIPKSSPPPFAFLVAQFPVFLYNTSSGVYGFNMQQAGGSAIQLLHFSSPFSTDVLPVFSPVNASLFYTAPRGSGLVSAFLWLNMTEAFTCSLGATFP